MTKTTFDSLAALNSITPVAHWVDAFNPCVKKWPKAAGEVPTPQMLTTAVSTFKNGRVGREALYMAMAMRPEGVTLAQFVLAGQPWGAAGRADNHIAAYSDQPRRAGGAAGLGWFSRHIMNTARCITLTAKGLKAVQGLVGKVNGAAVNEPKAVKKPVTAKRRPKAAPKPVQPNVPAERAAVLAQVEAEHDARAANIEANLVARHGPDVLNLDDKAA